VLTCSRSLAGGGSVQAALAGRPIVSPADMVRNLKLVSPALRGFVQEDAHEFLRLLVDALQRSFHASGSPRPQAPSASLAYPFALFRGAVQSTVQCGRCGGRSHSRDPIEDLGLELSPATASVEDALRLHTRAEALDGANCFACDRCRAKVRAVRRIGLHDVPALLVVQLKRFVYSQSAFGASKVPFPLF